MGFNNIKEFELYEKTINVLKKHNINISDKDVLQVAKDLVITAQSYTKDPLVFIPEKINIIDKGEEINIEVIKNGDTYVPTKNNPSIPNLDDIMKKYNENKRIERLSEIFLNSTISIHLTSEEQLKILDYLKNHHNKNEEGKSFRSY